MIIKEEATIPQIGSFNGKEKRETEKEEAVRMERKGRKKKMQQERLFPFFYFSFSFFYSTPRRSNELSPFNETRGDSFVTDSLLFRANR